MPTSTATTGQGADRRDTAFANDGINLIAECDVSNAMLRRYVHGPGTDDPIVWYEGTGTTDRRFCDSGRAGQHRQRHQQRRHDASDQQL